LVLGRATKNPANPLFCEDRPWEVAWLNTDPDVWYDNGVWKVFYVSCLACTVPLRRGHCPTKNYKFNPYRPSASFNGSTIKTGSRPGALLFANSTDGINFDKPVLGQVEFNGSRANNIASPFVGGVLLDHVETNVSQRWKMLNVHQFDEMPGVGFSSNGVQWSAPVDIIAAKEILAGRIGGDTHNNLYRISDTTFGAITRLDVRNSSNERRVALSTTSDFTAYTKAEQVLSGATGNQTYGMQVSPWAGLFIGSLAGLQRAGYQLRWAGMGEAQCRCTVRASRHRRQL
jgi:hypothetical protein